MWIKMFQTHIKPVIFKLPNKSKTKLPSRRIINIINIRTSKAKILRPSISWKSVRSLHKTSFLIMLFAHALIYCNLTLLENLAWSNFWGTIIYDGDGYRDNILWSMFFLFIEHLVLETLIQNWSPYGQHFARLQFRPILLQWGLLWWWICLIFSQTLHRL